jgi:hypothetical protein
MFFTIYRNAFKTQYARVMFSPRIGAKLPEDVVYEILTASGHGNWRAGKFIFRIVKWDKRIVNLPFHVRKRSWGVFASRARSSRRVIKK